MATLQLKELVRQLQDGDLSVFDDIYYQTKNLVYYTILNILKDQSLSEDIMQDTYLKALEKIHTYRDRVSFSAWIVTIGKNLALNEYNKRKREMNVDIAEDEHLFGSTESSSEKELIIRDLLNRLNESEREIVILHIVGDLKHREVAKIVNKPLGTVTWIYNEAMKKLRTDYESR